MKAHFIRALTSLVLWLLAIPSLVQANGRMPGANDVLFDPGDPQHVLVRATFGLVQSFDAGKSWQWICEQAIGTSGVIADPPIAIVASGSFVLLPPTGGALLSRDRGCSWADAGPPLSSERGVDLTLDPSDPAHLLVLTSTLAGVDDAGFGIYRNLLLETRDSAQSFQLVATLPLDFEAETVEVAASDPARIYVSGTASKNPRLGIVQRSDDGGAHWTQSSLELPAGTGSLLISAIHPNLPDKLWFRVPGRGDTVGVLPARLYVSDDKAQSFRMLASTRYGMFGFALAPDGSELVYGGPSDGLYVGPADGSTPFRKLSNLGVRCLRWPAEGSLYACGTEPANTFSLGASQDHGMSFEKLYAQVETCPQLCPEGTVSSAVCQEAWQVTRPFIRATAAMCSAPWAAAQPDAGIPDAGPMQPSAPIATGMDAATSGSAEAGSSDADTTMVPDGSDAEADTSDCSCRLYAGHAKSARRPDLVLALMLLALLVKRRRSGGV